MKRYIYSFLLVLASIVGVHAENGIIQTRYYKICPGDFITVSTRQEKISNDTIIRDTISVTDPSKDSIYVYVINLYPRYEKDEEHVLLEGKSFEWCDTTLTSGGQYLRTFKSHEGCDSIFRIHIIIEKTLSFTICDDEIVTYNGINYSEAGTYTDNTNKDTTLKITIIKHPTQLYQQTAVLDAINPYYWHYKDNGKDTVDTIRTAGMYEHITMNPQTGCNDIWRLFISKDETTYHFTEEKTICESEDFSWRGKEHLNKNNIGQKVHYFDRLKTKDGRDSIYELVLKVNPVLRTQQTIPFCGSIYWNGKTYKDKSEIIIDTLTSVEFGCDSIVTTYLAYGRPFHYHDTMTLTTGETAVWRGQVISTSGYYEEKHISSFGCDSIYSLGVGLKEAVPQMNIHREVVSICEGDIYPWRKKNYRESGRYVDTLYKAGSSTEIDSLYVLDLTVNPTYDIVKRVSFTTYPQNYNGKVITGVGNQVYEYKTIHGCDSIVTIYFDEDVIYDEQSAEICAGDEFGWRGKTYKDEGRYVDIEVGSRNQDSIQHILNLKVKYIPKTYITKTICSGSSYTFGDQTLTKTDIYEHTFHVNGCDSTVVLSLNVVDNDTIKFVHHMNKGDKYKWHGEFYEKEGIWYYSEKPNRFGCDSIEMLIITYNHVDTVDTAATICPNEIPFQWHGITASQSGRYNNVEQLSSGEFVYYRLDLTVREMQYVNKDFIVCGNEDVSYNGKKYTEAGYYTDYLGCDTIVTIHVKKKPIEVHEFNASLGGEHGYKWTYWSNGQEQTEVFYKAGTYEYESVNEETGCNDIWRLILSEDKTVYHFVETVTICEGDDFTWRGMTNLSHQGIGTTTSYTVDYKTRTGQDSIYELLLTVTPVKRTVQTKYFCSSIEWGGKTYTESHVVYDTIASPEGCYEIRRTNLEKAHGFYSKEEKTIVQGDIIFWHDIMIDKDGVYYDRNFTIHGCDSVYELTVTVEPASEHTNMYTEQMSICQGDTLLWRGKDIWTEGRYVETVQTGEKDSIFILNLTVWPSYKDTIVQHLYTCGDEAFIRYQGKDYFKDQVITEKLATIHGCDSLVKTYLHFNTALYLTDTVTISDNQLPYKWNYRLSGSSRDTTLTTAGTYYHAEEAEGGCYNREELVLIVYPTYLYEDTAIICETELPYHWLTGPKEHVNDDLQHQVGTWKQYEYRYQSVFKTDSIFRLQLRIDPAPKDTVQVYLCEGDQIKVGDRVYVNINSDSVYHDTLHIPNPNNGCDSIIYYEIYQHPHKQTIETAILHPGDTIKWRGREIVSAGTISVVDSIDKQTGCGIENQLRVIADQRATRVICVNDTAKETHPDQKYPFVWVHPYPGRDNDTLYTTGIYTDTVFDDSGLITDFYSLDLTITQPYDTVVYVHGCQTYGAWWRDSLYRKDTVFVDRVPTIPYNPMQPCDSVFHVHIVIDTVYATYITDTICEPALPYILGRVNPDTIWGEVVSYLHNDTTACGCDSLIYLTLRIKPDLQKTDSTFKCEDEIKENPVILGNLDDPWFDHRENGKFHGTWEGKWQGISYTKDTIVYNCDSSFHHHIIVRPSQKVPFDTTYLMCAGDSVQLFWPKTEWVKKDTVYFDTVPMQYEWTDDHHGISYKDQNYVCDSVVRWTVKFVHPEFKDTTAHRLLGDSIWWGGAWRYYTGVYDSIGPASHKNSDSIPCKLTYTLNLIMDTAYYFRDTIFSLCSDADKSHVHIWKETGYKQSFTVGKKDSLPRHYVDSMKTYDRRDSIYDLCVYYHITRDTLIFDTICEDTRYRFDSIHTERWLTKAGTYHDTVMAVNGCDSAITLMLYVRPRVVTKPKEVMITDRETPYLWPHSWYENNARVDSTDTLRATGLYTFRMPSAYGCDSIDSLYLTVHQTHVFRDTIDVCNQINKTLTHVWKTEYVQEYTTPLKNDTAYYYDTLQTRIKYDSIYVLCVNFHQTYFYDYTDTICEGDRYRFDRHVGNLTYERWLDKRGIYKDTLQTQYGCDSVIQLRLVVPDRIEVNHPTVHIADVDTPYVWKHTWKGADGNTIDSTRYLYASGEYECVMQTARHRCDSIDSLTLVVHNTYKIYEDTITICQSETPFAWQNRNDIMESGLYSYHTQTHDFYDSTRYVYVKVLPVLKNTVLHDTICEGDTYRFGLTRSNKIRELTESGVYYDTLTSHQYGCDSIIELRLNVYAHYHNAPQTKHVSVGELPYIWRHKQGGKEVSVADTLRAEGEYSYTFTTRFGCDSVDTLSLRVHQTYLFRDSVIICANETPYEWEGIKDIYTTDEYIKHLQTHDGYDSTHVRYVEVRPILRKLITATICEGDSLRFGLTKMHTERYLTKDGIYYDTLTSVQYGCDSIIELRLNVYPRFFHDSIRHIADVDTPFIWHHVAANGKIFKNDTLYAAGGYEFRYESKFGCDSIDSLHLFIHNTYKFTEDITICERQTPYTWQNRNDITESGTYIYNPHTKDGYDSIFIANITVIKTAHEIIHEEICDNNLPFIFHGKELYKGGIYIDSIYADNGCDSIVELHLTVNNAYYHFERHDIYDNETYQFFDQTCKTSGTYTHKTTTPAECDSITELMLVVHPLVDTIATVCSYDLPFAWRNHWTGDTTWLHSSGIYHDDTTYVNGERTFWSIQLIVTEPGFDTIRHSMCEGGSYLFAGQVLTQTGIYYDTITAPNGCDSIKTLVLTVNKPYFKNIPVHIIEGNSYEFYGKTYTESGTYPHYGVTPTGCDSTTILQLVVHPMVDTVVTVCKTELPYMWVNKWNGQITPLYEAGLYRNDTTYDENGQQLFYGLKLIVTLPTDTTIYREICEDDVYNFNGRFLSEAGEYRDTIRNANGCDSIMILHLNVLKKYYNTIERSIYEGDTVLFNNKVYSEAGVYPVRMTSSFGCDSVIELKLNVYRLFDDSISVCANDLPYTWRNKTILESGLYRDTIYGSEGKQSIVGIKVNVLPIAHLEEPIVATICEGTQYKFGDSIYTTQGTYYDTLVAANGCDSVVTLVLQVQPLNHKTEYKTIFDGDSVEFYGEWYKKSGHYEHIVTNDIGCDDVHTLILTVLKSFNVDTTAYVCKEDIPFKWHGYEYSESGNYTLPISWNDSSRVTMTLHLTVNDNFYGERNIAICKGDTFYFNKRKYYDNCEFYDTIPSLTGCDSIIKYIVSVHPVFSRDIIVHVSDKQPYIFHDRTLTTTGTYEWTGKTKEHGCDSIERLLLTVHPSYFFSDTIDICQSDTLLYPYKWLRDDGSEIMSISQTGVYTDSVLTEFGFDSVHQLVVYVHPKYLINEQYEIADGELLKIHGKDISKPAIYYDTLRTIHGCDSIFHVVINQKRTREFTWYKEICNGEYYEFFGKKLTHTGKYIYTSMYKDSIVTLNLTVNPISITEKRVVITDKQLPYIYEGHMYDKAGVYADTLVNYHGCDSIHRLVLVVSSRYSEWIPMPLCPGSEIKIDGEVITEAGLYTFLRRSRVTGEMDSIYRVEVYDAPAYDMPTEVRTICDGDTIFIGGKAVTRAGHYDFTLKTSEGCDSILHLDLTVNPSYQYYTDITIRDFESYTWLGKTYTEEGNYDRTWPTYLGCDSTYTLRLKVLPTQRYITVDTICEGQKLTWRGKQYDTDGYFTDTVYRPETFYSAIYTLQLTVMRPTFITHATVNDICADDESFDIAFTYTGAQPTTYSIFFDQQAKNEGFEDVINKPFLGEDRIARALVPIKKTVLYLGHTDFVRPNKYSMKLVLDNGVCGLSQSDSLVLLVKYPSWIIEQNWNDVVAPLKAEYNGGYQFSKTDWYVNGKLQPNNGQGYLHNEKLVQGDEVYMVATRKGENYSIPTCPIVINIDETTEYEEPILVYPTRAPRFAPNITIKANNAGKYSIFSSTGMLISSGTFDAGKQQVTLPASCGIYFIRTENGDEAKTHKVILY